MAPSKSDVVNEKLEKAQAQLEAALTSLKSSDDWKAAMRRLAILGPLSVNRFSFRNLLLLAAQAPESRHVATFKAWLARDRHVRKGEKALTVLRPRIVPVAGVDDAGAPAKKSKLVGFSYMSVFALEQTDGAPLPEPMLPRRFDTPEGFAWTAQTLRELVAKLPGVGGIQLRPRQPGDLQHAAGWFHRVTTDIVVISGETSEAQQFKTLLHEVAHALLHGVEDHHSRPVQEVEAESTAFVVAHALGLDTASYSLPYVAQWALEGEGQDATKLVAAAGERIRKAAGAMLEALVPQTEATVEPEAVAA